MLRKQIEVLYNHIMLRKQIEILYNHIMLRKQIEILYNHIMLRKQIGILYNHIMLKTFDMSKIIYIYITILCFCCDFSGMKFKMKFNWHHAFSPTK